MKTFEDNTSEAYLEAQLHRQYAYTPQVPSPPPLQSELSEYVLQTMTPDYAKRIEAFALYKTIDQLHAALDMGFITVRELTLFFLYRALKINSLFHPIIAINPHCLEAAEQVDLQFQSGTAATQLMGIPLWLKDNIATQDPIPTTCGAAALSQSFSNCDATIVSHLRNAGAIVLGKANLSEWANFMSTNSANGYSVVGGQTKNPYGHFDVGGSSSGSAVAVALGLSPISIGTETCGSLVYPASQNAVVTLKPPQGALCSNGIIPIATSLDTAGPMALSVRDVYQTYMGLGAIVTEIEQPDFTHAHMSSIRIGLAMSAALNGEYRHEDLEILYRIKSELTSLGAEAVTVNLPEAAFTPPLLKTLHEEFVPSFSAYMSYSNTDCSLEEVLAYNSTDPSQRAPFGQDLLEESVRTPGAIGSNDTLEMQEMERAILDSLFKDYNLDLIFNLSNYLAPLHALSGYPALTVPCGYRLSGEPVGVTFVGRPKDLKQLFEVADRYEETTGYRKPPSLASFESTS